MNENLERAFKPSRKKFPYEFYLINQSILKLSPLLNFEDILFSIGQSDTYYTIDRSPCWEIFIPGFELLKALRKERKDLEDYLAKTIRKQERVGIFQKLIHSFCKKF